MHICVCVYVYINMNGYIYMCIFINQPYLYIYVYIDYLFLDSLPGLDSTGLETDTWGPRGTKSCDYN
jgi:hypothetical protein